jgi:hypothetical protein
MVVKLHITSLHTILRVQRAGSCSSLLEAFFGIDMGLPCENVKNSDLRNPRENPNYWKVFS